MDISVIIPAAGQSRRWNNYLNIPKHLVGVDDQGTVLINRTINLLRSHGVNDIYVITDNSIIIDAVKNAEIVKPQSSRYLTDTILSARDKWGSRTAVVLGDVFYSYECVEKILTTTDDLMFFGVSRINKQNRRPEIYAFSYNRSCHDDILINLKRSSKLANLRDSGNLLYNAIKELFKKDYDCLKNVYSLCYKPKPPLILRKIGIQKGWLWRLYRSLIRKPCCDWMFGKLWGLYLMMNNLDPYGSKNYSWPECNDILLEAIDDITRDIDLKEDYIKLLAELNLSKETRSA